MENISRGTKRPAEPAGPDVQPQLQTTTSTQPITLRMSSIPIAVTKGDLSRILEGLGTFRNLRIDEPSQTEAKLLRGGNIRSLSLAPLPSSFDSDTYQVAIVTFNETPPELVARVSNTDTVIVLFGTNNEKFEVDVNSHFRGLTPLNRASNPSLEYVVLLPLKHLLVSHFILSERLILYCLALLPLPDSQDMPSVPGDHAILERCGYETSFPPTYLTRGS